MTEPRFVTTRFLKITYHAWGDPSGKTVVLMHGFPDDAAGWHATAEALVSTGYYAIAPCLRSYGGTSSATSTAQHSDLAADLSDF